MEAQDVIRCEFLEKHGPEFAVNLSRSKLHDDIAENGRRPLTGIERMMVDRMIQEQMASRQRTPRL